MAMELIVERRAGKVQIKELSEDFLIADSLRPAVGGQHSRVRRGFCASLAAADAFW
ncbi:MAG: hypothetical protein SVT52_09210 [Planctomycetota bacterium]|nr:hypothetical protein [Planctomycetota bacterium]